MKVDERWTLTPAQARDIVKNENADYQAPFNPEKLGRLRRLMKEDSFKPGALSFEKRPDGTRVLLDGQHRLQAAYEVGRTYEWPIRLYCDVTPEERKLLSALRR